MADELESILPEVVVNNRNEKFDLTKMMNLGGRFLKSNRFALKIYNLPAFISIFSANELRNITFLCDSLEFPGQSITPTDIRIPGEFRKRIPYLRDVNEVTMTFFFPSDIPVYQMFSSWMYGISPTATDNSYFDDIVCDLHLAQFSDIDTVLSSIVGGNSQSLSKDLTEAMLVTLRNAYPLNMASLPSNWSDDGFHKITVTFAFETIEMKGLDPADFLEEVEITSRLSGLPDDIKNSATQEKSKPGLFSFFSGMFTRKKTINNNKFDTNNPFASPPVVGPATPRAGLQD